MNGLAALSRLGVLMVLAVSAVASLAGAQGFRPGLGQAKELIDGGSIRQVTPPRNSEESLTYTIPPEMPKSLLTELPDRPFKPVDPPPRSLVWWKLPFYTALGLPRDMVDATIGALAKLSLVSVLVYPVYEVVPTQCLFRDPRDWHRWDAHKNKNEHGYYDGASWGWFPSAHQWGLTHESERKLRKYKDYNHALKEELRERNVEIEAYNQGIESYKRDARREALAALQTGNGREAALRMVPYYNVYPLDEGAFALFVASLALYRPDGPEWVGPLLCYELNDAQPGLLAQAEEVLTKTVGRFPEHAALAETLIYTRLLMGGGEDAHRAALALLDRRPADARCQLLVYETALSSNLGANAQAALGGIDAQSLNERDYTLALARLRLLTGEYLSAHQALAAMREATPDDAYVNYYLGCAELMRAQSEDAYLEGFAHSFDLLERAALMAPGPALRLRAGQALSYARGLGKRAEGRPELFSIPELLSR